MVKTEQNEEGGGEEKEEEEGSQIVRIILGRPIYKLSNKKTISYCML